MEIYHCSFERDSRNIISFSRSISLHLFLNTNSNLNGQRGVRTSPNRARRKYEHLPGLTTFHCGMAELMGSEIKSGFPTVHLGGPSNTDYYPSRAICKTRVARTCPFLLPAPPSKSRSGRQVGARQLGSPSVARPLPL